MRRTRCATNDDGHESNYLFIIQSSPDVLIDDEKRTAIMLAIALATSGLCATRPPTLRSPAVLRRAAAPRAAEHVAGETCTGERVTVVGATGYIGKAVVREAVRRGYVTTAVARDVAKARGEPKFEGATLSQADVCDPQSLSAPGGPFEQGKVDSKLIDIDQRCIE